jgi:hypothetical protein
METAETRTVDAAKQHTYITNGSATSPPTKTICVAGVGMPSGVKMMEPSKGLKSIRASTGKPSDQE